MLGTTKKCNKCKRTLSHDRFYIRRGADARKKNREGEPFGHCKDCRRVNRNNNPHTYFVQMLAHVRRRVREKKLDYDLNIDFLKRLYSKQGGGCPISGQPLTLLADGKGHKLTNASLDRINNDRGYTKDNVRMVCWIVNIMRHNQRDDQLLSWCYKIIEHQENLNGSKEKETL